MTTRSDASPKGHLRSHLTYANVMATGAIFIALGGGAYAVTSGIPDHHGVFHGCVNKRTGALRLVSSASSCRKGSRKRPAEFAVSWNQQGQPGTPGSPGAPGTPATRLWAVVNGAGSFERGSGVAIAPGTDTTCTGNSRCVPFGQDLSRCTWLAAIGGADPLSGTIAGFVNTTLLADKHTLEVSMSDKSGAKVQNQDFHLAVFC